jgi:hypothetical protein
VVEEVEADLIHDDDMKDINLSSYFKSIAR